MYTKWPMKYLIDIKASEILFEKSLFRSFEKL